jgi:hypothetical protein
MPNYYNAPPYQPPYTNPWGQTAVPNGYQSNYIQTNQTNQQPNLNNIMVVPVSGQENAESYPVAMGLTVMLLDYDNGVFWLKSNDGVSPKLTKHTFVVEEAPTEKKRDISEASVSRKEFDILKEKVDSLLKNLGENEEE